jgi:hypothetical protein
MLTAIFFIGLSFWKTTARKIFAVKKKSKQEPKAVVLVEDDEIHAMKGGHGMEMWLHFSRNAHS